MSSCVSSFWVQNKIQLLANHGFEQLGKIKIGSSASTKQDQFRAWSLLDSVLIETNLMLLY